MTTRSTVSTVRGTVDATELGSTLMHEHVFVRSLETTLNYSATWVSDDVRVDAAIETLRSLETAGIGTIVDLTVLGLGRDIRLVSRVAEAVNLHIVAATGAYVLDRLPYQLAFNPPKKNGSTSEGLAEWFISDIREGIEGTRIRAGAIKCATDVAGLTPDVETVLRAAAMTARETGAPIITHADAETMRGLEQQRVFSSEGVDLSRVVIGHAGDSTDHGYLRALMDAGSTIGMDRFGLEDAVSTAEKIRVVAELCALGYADRMVLSHDAACHSEWMDPATTAAHSPEWSLLLIPQKIVPELRNLGVAEEDIHRMLVLNPQRLLGSLASANGGEES